MYDVNKVKELMSQQIGINTRAEQECQEFLKIMDECGFSWCVGKKACDYSPFYLYGKNTVIRYVESYGGLVYCSKGYYEKQDYKFISYQEFLKRINQEFLKRVEQDYPTITEHLIRGNNVIIKLSNGKVGVARCNPTDKFDIAIGTELAVKRAYGTEKYVINDYGTETINDELKVGDIVRVVDKGEQYSCYLSFFEENKFTKYINQFIKRGEIKNGEIAEIKAIGKHSRGNDLYVIEADNKIYLFPKDGLEKVKILKQDKYEIGDKVKIVELEKLVKCRYYASPMEKWAGKILTVNFFSVCLNDNNLSYCLVSENDWSWYNKMIEGKV